MLKGLYYSEKPKTASFSPSPPAAVFSLSGSFTYLCSMSAVNQPSTSMIASDIGEESRAGSGVDSSSHGRLTNDDRHGRHMKLNPASSSQCRFPTLQNNETYAKLPRGCPSDHCNVCLLIIGSHVPRISQLTRWRSLRIAAQMNLNSITPEILGVRCLLSRVQP